MCNLCARIGSGETPMHRKCACDRHRIMRAHCKRRIADVSRARTTVIANCAQFASVEPKMHRKCACDRHRTIRAHRKRRTADACKVAVRPSLQHARTLQAPSRRCIATCGATVIATCAHIASAGLPMHCNLRCDRHRSMRAHCKRRIADALQLAVRPSSQHARTLQAQDRRGIASCGATVIATYAHIASAGSSTHCKLQCDRHRNMRDIASAELWMHCKLRGNRHRNIRAHSKRRISDASQVRVRPSSQHARTSQAQNCRCIASCGATVIATCAHITSAGSPTHCKLWCGRHDFMHAKADAAAV